MPERDLTIDDLKRLLRVAAGDSDVADLDGDIVDVRFEELGYDSIALLETASLIERDFGVKVGDDIAGADTPREFLAQINAAVAAP
ncbi:acyl carrier protein [Nonomuraea sp. NPDC050451]|uniref:acyl carrier protein n=1 Tax=Nonomuraea sp. NPDC050451 TaxID=3364364 RepID=UPI0037B8DDA0